MNGAIAFPLVYSQQSFPLNGADFAATPVQTFPQSFTESRARYYEFRPLVGLEFDGDTRLYGYEGQVGDATFYYPKVLNIGEITKEVPQMWGLYSISSCTITLDNSDKEFSILKDTSAFYGRVGWVAMCEPYYGEGSITRLFTGKIDSWVIQGNKISITLRDATGDRFLNSINQYATVLNTTDFPNLPAYQTPKLIPIAVGVQTRTTTTVGGDDIAVGVLPAYMVDPAIGQPKYQYAALGHSGSATGLDVFVYSILQTSGYNITTATIASGLFITFINFDVDPRDFGTHSPDETEVTFSPSDSLITDSIIPGNGTLPSIAISTSVTTAVQDLQTLLYEFDIYDVEFGIDGNAWNAASSAIPITSEMAIVREDETIQTILSRHAETFLEWFYMTKDGLFAITSAFETATSSITVSDSENIIRNSFAVSSNRTLASRLQYNYSYNHVGQYFEKQPDLHDAGEETNLGQDIRDNRNLWYSRVDTPTDIATKAMESMTENTQLVSFSLPIRYHAYIDVTKVVTLSHFEGIDSSGLGYDNVSVRILSVRFRPHPSESQIEVKGIVLP